MTLRPVLIPVAGAEPLRTAAQVAAQRRVARQALEQCARSCGAPVSGWRQREDGAPLPNGKWYWSISHKPQWAGAVVADRPVGIDIECIAPRRRDLTDHLGGDAEWALMGDRSWPSFFRLWTAKEAVLKSHSAGIGSLLVCRLDGFDDRGRMVLMFDGFRHVVAHHWWADHVAAVVCGDDPVEWIVLGDRGRGQRA